VHNRVLKNNTEGLRAQVRRTITAFLLAQMNNGAFGAVPMIFPA
jgi:hypothetical protein